ncbi:MAG: PEP-utilizing enzyme [Candidatus Saccharimonadales bacterium]
MTDYKLAKLLKTQKSLTEWLEDIKHADTSAIRKEDNEKRERLKVLNEVIGLPFDKPTQFEASQLNNQDKSFGKFMKSRGNELCALRLIPKEKDLPKLRMRGKTIREAFSWFLEQDINPADYRADFVPHPPDYSWATIFIVNKHGIQGEIIFGGHHQLTQGFHDDKPPLAFRYDFTNWTILPDNPTALVHLKKLAELIHVADKSKQKQLNRLIGAVFINNYLQGYFETTDSSMGTWYIDYSKSLGDMYADTTIRTSQSSNTAIVSGQTGSSGVARGPVCLVDADNLAINLPSNAILVCEVTTPSYVPLMQKAAAIVTNQGGILSHAAIVARELHKPCIVGTTNATKALKNGQTVIVDADEGTVVVAEADS